MRSTIGQGEYYAVVGLIHLVRDQAQQLNQTTEALKRLLDDDEQYTITDDLPWNTDTPDQFLKDLGVDVQGP